MSENSIPSIIPMYYIVTLSPPTSFLVNLLVFQWAQPKKKKMLPLIA